MNFIKKNELFLLEEVVTKNFSAKYKGSVLGIFWTVLSPLLMMALFTILFSTLFNQRIVNYPIYFLCGWCLFQFFSSSVSGSMEALRANKNILQTTAVPKYIFVLGGIISDFLNFIIMMGLLIVVMIITKSPFFWSTLPFAIIPVFSLVIMLIGLGLIVSIVCVYYTDIKYLWSVISMMFMYASAIFYPMAIIPEPFQSYLCLNPLYWVIDQFRCFVYQGIIPDIFNMVNLFILSLVIFVVGIIIFKKYENTIVLKF